jgi:hypothetical protein
MRSIQKSMPSPKGKPPTPESGSSMQPACPAGPIYSIDQMLRMTRSNATTKVASFTRKRSSEKPFPKHLPRERLVVPGPMACGCCGGPREDITETLEVIPKSWKLIRMSARSSHAVIARRSAGPWRHSMSCPRGWAGPSLLAMVLFEKFWPASAAQRASGELCQGRRADQPIDLG